MAKTTAFMEKQLKSSPPSPQFPYGKGMTPEHGVAIQKHIDAGAEVTITYAHGGVTEVTVDYVMTPMTGGGMMGASSGSYIYDEMTTVAESVNALKQWSKKQKAYSSDGSGLEMKVPEHYGKFRDDAIANPPKSVQEMLDRAEQAIEELGWIKGALHSTNGVCMVGAIDLVGMNTGLREMTKDVLLRAIKGNMLYNPDDYGEFGPHSIPDFNDDEGTNLETVKLAFKHARHHLESK